MVKVATLFCGCGMIHYQQYRLLGGSVNRSERTTKNYLSDDGKIHLRDARQQAGLTQERLAEIANLNGKWDISRIETGTSKRITVTKAVSISEALGLSLRSIKEFGKQCDIDHTL